MRNPDMVGFWKVAVLLAWWLAVWVWLIWSAFREVEPVRKPGETVIRGVSR